MNDDRDNVHQMPAGYSRGANGGGNGFEGRLRLVEQKLSAIEAEQKHSATKADIAEVKTLIADVKTLIQERESSMLRWLVTLTATAGLSILIALIRTFM